MSVNTYDELRAHIGHKIECVCYGADGEDPDNIALECVDCSEVLVSYDQDEEESTVEPYSEKALEDSYGYWEEHPRFPREDWRYEVSNNETGCSYWAHVEGCIESQMDDLRDIDDKDLPKALEEYEDWCDEVKAEYKKRLANLKKED